MARLVICEATALVLRLASHQSKVAMQPTMIPHDPLRYANAGTPTLSVTVAVKLHKPQNKANYGLIR